MYSGQNGVNQERKTESEGAFFSLMTEMENREAEGCLKVLNLEFSK